MSPSASERTLYKRQEGAFELSCPSLCFQFLADNVGGDADGRLDDLKTAEDITVSIGKGLFLLENDAVCKCVGILTDLILRSGCSDSPV